MAQSSDTASALAASPAKRRQRRSKEQIVECLLQAAIEEFQENGYDKARTAAIAQRAAVAEPLLFKHFSTKFNLFQRAIFRTLDQHFREFTSSHEPVSGDKQTRARNARDYIGEQQDFLETYSRMFMSLVVNESYDLFAREGMGEIDGLQLFLDKVSATAGADAAGPATIAPQLVARISFATLMATVLFRKWLFPQDMASDAEIRSAIADFVMKGADISGRGEA